MQASHESRTGTRTVRRLRRAELPIETVALARFLIGKTLVHDLPGGRLAGRIVETEAYLPDDQACHAFVGETRRNRALFLEHGHAYVYFSYGCWSLMNVSSEPAGTGAGVLLRALEPLDGIAVMEERRNTRRLHDLARGPGRLSVAMGITLSDSGRDLCNGGSLWLGASLRPAGEIGVSIRIGISKAADKPLRFYEIGSRHLSGPARLNAAPVRQRAKAGADLRARA
jgi:DNA-3-methyladenine glycosylase